MKKAIIIILAALLMLCVFVACDNEDIIDSLLGYMVTFDANGGEGEMEDQTIPNNGTTLNPNEFTRKDYFFVCWNTQEDGEGTSYVDKAEIKLTEGITLYAQWEHSESVITFDANGGEGEMEMQTVLTNVPTELNLNEFTREEYLFGSWNTDPAGEGESFEDGEAAAIDGNTTLYAQWVQPVITFDANGGTGEMEPQVVPCGVATELEPIGTIERDGYEFIEWNTDPEGKGASYDAGDKITITEDLTLYAMWKGDKVLVKFDANGGAVVKKVLEVVVGLPYGDELPQKSIKKNYEFDGWWTEREGGTEVDEYTIVTYPYDHTLYAHWRPATYAIDYELKGGKINSGEVDEYTYGIGAVLPTDVSKNGFEFRGWYDNATYQGEPVTAVSETDSGDKTFYARWKKTGVEYLTATTTTWQDGYTYSLDPKTTDPLVIADRITVTGDVTLILPDGMTLTASEGITVSDGNNLTIEGGKDGTGKLIATGEDHAAGIGGGNNKGGGTVSITGGTVIATAGENATEGIGKGNGGTDSGKLIIGEGQGLYGGDDKTTAKFISAPTDDYKGDRYAYMSAETTEYVTVTFDANGGTGTMDPQTVPAGIGVPLNANTFQHATLFFAGWALSSEGDVVYADKASVNLTEDTTLYAKWIDVISLDDTYGGSGKKLTGGLRYTIADDLTLPGRLYIDGTSEVTLILPKGKTLTLSNGINVESGKELIIEGEGSLVVTAGGMDGAGIGGGEGQDAGTITITGGTIVTKGSSFGAGIGGGLGGDGGTILISGKSTVVKATGGGQAAGIGGGWKGKGGTVTISGGTVTANGDDSEYSGEGIGRGYQGSESGTIKIGSGYVLAGGDVCADTVLIGPVDKETEYPGTSSHPIHMIASTVSEIKDSTAAITLPTGVYTLDKNDTDVNVSGRITVDGSVILLLPEGATLTTSKGITVATGNSLAINGDGNLIAKVENATIEEMGNAGIGGYSGNKKSGIIVINGGNISATGGYYAGAGIGGGGWQASCGTVIINGGIVKATGGGYGAGIGGGNGGSGGSVTINGGTVTATGGDMPGATGIGAGSGSTTHGTLKIGAGYVLTGGSASLDTVLLGPVDAETTYSGDSHPRYMKVSKPIVLTSSTTAWTSGNVYTLGDENVTIVSRITVNGTVFLLLPDGKKLTASKGITVTGSNSLTINGGTGQNAGILVATGEDSQAGIGGINTQGNANGGTVTINGGKVTATGGNCAAGIGGAYGGDGGTISISGGVVEATGGKLAAGIGGGEFGIGGNVTINGGNVTATGGEESSKKGMGIGAGADAYQSDHGKLTIGYGVLVYITGETEDYAIGPRDNVAARYRNMTVIKP